MSNFGSFNFNISKSTPTTSTTNTNTTSLPIPTTPKPSLSTTNPGTPSRDSTLTFLKSHKGTPEASINIGSVNTTSASGDLTYASPKTSEPNRPGEKQDLINIFEKFNLEKTKSHEDVDSVEEKFEQFKAMKQAQNDESVDENEVHGKEVEKHEPISSSNEQDKGDHVTPQREPTIEDSKDIDEGNTPKSEKLEVDTKLTAQSENRVQSPDSQSMTMQPYIIEEGFREEDESVPETEAVMDKKIKAKNAGSRENSPPENGNDFLAMDNNDPIEEVQIEIPQTSESQTPLEIGGTQPQRPRAHRKDSIAKASKGIVNASEQHQQSHRPFDFQVFLSHLKNKNADPIVRYIRSFLMSFARQASTMSASQMMKAVKNFKLFIEEKFQVYEPFASMDDTDVENSVEGVEKLIMNRLYEFCFPPEATKKFTIRAPSAMAKDLSDDASFQRQVEKFSWVSGIHLDVDLDSLSEKKKKAAKDGIDYMEYAATELNKINNYRAPRDKIICILNACKILFSLLRATDQETNADAFIPLLILVILKAKTEHIVSNLHYIERFRGENWLNHGETSYYLSTMQGAISFIQNIKREDLTIDDSHYDAHMEAWDAEMRQRGWKEEEPLEEESAADNAGTPTHRQGMLPSNVLMASAEMFTKSISSLMTPSSEATPEPSTAEGNAQARAPEFTESQVDETFNQLSEIFPSLDKDILRDVIVMNNANFEVSLDVCLQLVNDS